MSEKKGVGREFIYFAFFALATVVLTWPIAFSLNKATSIRPDYFTNLWNIWWIKTALTNWDLSPYWTDYIFYPAGISLIRHGISPFNSIAGALLSTFLSLHAVFNILLLLHFTLSAWAFFLLARYLTGNTPGSILAGLIYTFCPFHYFYMQYLMGTAFEFLPLSVLYFLKTYRHGGGRNSLLMAFFVGMLAACSHQYYLVYGFLLAGLLVLGGKLWDPRIPALLGIRRLLIASIPTAILVVIIYLPFFLDIIHELTQSPDYLPQSHYFDHRANNLWGYRWIGPPEFLFVSWPTMLGYTTLTMLLLGYREVIKQKFWLLVGGFFLILSLGATLKIGSIDTNFSLPYKYLQHLPVFSLLRKPDRCFLVIQFSIALLCAFSWRHIATWFENRNKKLVFWGICTVLILTETTGVPFSRFTYECPAYLKDVVASSEVQSLIHLPPASPSGLYNKNARYMFFQTFHEKKIPQGYIASLALGPDHRLQLDRLEQLYDDLASGNAGPILEELQKTNTDLLVIHKTVLEKRKYFLRRRTRWEPFFVLKHKLVKSRQVGPFIEEPLSEKTITVLRITLKRELGKPIYEDSEILVFSLR